MPPKKKSKQSSKPTDVEVLPLAVLADDDLPSTSDLVQKSPVNTTSIFHQLGQFNRKDKSGSAVDVDLMRVQKETILALVEADRAIVTPNLSEGDSSSKKSSIWPTYGSIQLLATEEEVIEVNIDYVKNDSGDIFCKYFVSCLKCNSMFMYRTHNGTSTLRNHADKCSMESTRKAPKINTPQRRPMVLGGETILFTNKPRPTVVRSPVRAVVRPLPENERENEHNLTDDSMEIEEVDSPPSSPSKLQPKVEKKAVPDKKRKELQEQVLLFMVDKLRPFSILDDALFLELLQSCVDLGASCGEVNIKTVIGTKREFKDQIFPSMFEQVQSRLKKSLGRLVAASFTCDIWTADYRKTYLSAAIHYTNDSNDLQHLVIRSDEFPYEHNSSSNVRQWFDTICEENDMTRLKRLMVLDDSPNMAAAFLGEPTVKCVWLCLNDSMQTIFNQALDTDNVENTIPNFFNLVQNARAIATHLTDERLNAKLATPLKAYADNKWNKLIKLLRVIQSQYKEIGAILAPRSEMDLLLAVDNVELRTVVEFFQPFVESVGELSALNLPTLNLVIPWFVKLKKCCASSAKDTETVKALKAIAAVALETKVAPFLGEHHRLATILDSRFKKLLFLDADERSSTIARLKELANGWQMPNKPTSKAESGRVPVNDPFADLYSPEIEPQEEKVVPKGTEEVERYLEETFKLDNERDFQRGVYTPLRYWGQAVDKYPIVSQIAFWYLSCPAGPLKNYEVVADPNWIIHCRKYQSKCRNVHMALSIKSALTG